MFIFSCAATPEPAARTPEYVVIVEKCFGSMLVTQGWRAASSRGLIHIFERGAECGNF